MSMPTPSGSTKEEGGSEGVAVAEAEAPIVTNGVGAGVIKGTQAEAPAALEDPGAQGMHDDAEIEPTALLNDPG